MSKFKTDAQLLKINRRLQDKQRGREQARFQDMIVERERFMEAPDLLNRTNKDKHAPV